MSRPLRVVIYRAGGHEQLKLRSASTRAPGPGEVRVAVRAIGVNYADCIVRMGLYASAKRYVGWPITPGFEVAGTVDAVGDAVGDAGAAGEAFAVGDRVLAVTRFGGYTSSLVVPRAQVFHLPAEPALSFEQAAALPTVFLTAWYALHRLGDARPGQRVLVHSGAGGVGGALVQLASRAGCEVVAVVGAPHKIEPARAFGAARVIDKSREPLWGRARQYAPEGYALVCDANGVETLRASYEHLMPTGRLVVYGFHTMLPRSGRARLWQLAWHLARTPWFNPLRLTEENRAVMGFNLSFLFERRDLLADGMAEILRALAAGEITAPPVSVYPLRDVARAHQAIESGQTVGKLVLVP